MSEWTTELPTEPGWYWLDEPGMPLDTVRVTGIPADQYAYTGIDGWFQVAGVASGSRWQRIPAPQDAPFRPEVSA